MTKTMTMTAAMRTTAPAFRSPAPISAGSAAVRYLSGPASLDLLERSGLALLWVECARRRAAEPSRKVGSNG